MNHLLNKTTKLNPKASLLHLMEEDILHKQILPLNESSPHFQGKYPFPRHLMGIGSEHHGL
jgi:hypothetical protein